MNDLKVINFMRLRSCASLLSLLLMLGSVGALAVKGINWGLDFTGGTLIELVYDQPVKTSDIRDQLATAGYENVVVQEFGSAEDILVRIPGDDPKIGAAVAALLGQNYDGNVEAVRVEFVGPQVGERLRDQGGLGMLFAMLLITLYIAFRFQFKFSVGAILSLAHDVIFTLGLFALSGLQFDLTVMAALLAVIGYSLNDTIIVYDRIRENFRKLRKGDPEEIINVSLTQTLGRTLATSGTTLMVLLALFLFGGDMIHNFALALIVGVGVGTYSSIYIASNMLIYMRISRDDLIVPVKENDDIEQMP
ncbi:protein translocase subunit SecF [Endozoicomonas sp. ONNA2]|uniref:protein translocase subunit SecF n=1 Tax=Endozoicomonas sp. ONNA2 TaxID=2828741 RepID=UPI00214952EA|nr:protein translocase subunit SecF [Endozoicomonas sp. ONNA2]